MRATAPTPPPHPAHSDPAESWTKVIRPQSSLLDLRIGELWRYRDLVMMFVRRDFVFHFKQTLLGPLWFFLQPLLTTITYIIIFGKMAQLSTDGVPMMLFYLSGITIWNYFAESLNRTATVFKDNQAIMGKVYFPRMAVPLSIVIANLYRLGVQLLLFLAVWVYFLLQEGAAIRPNAALLLTPLLVLIMGLLGLGFGMIFSALTNKYKDLMFLLTFGIQLFMFATPVIYPVNMLSQPYRTWILANPVSSVIETFRYGFLGSGHFSPLHLSYSLGVSLVIFLAGTVIFNRAQKSFSDTI